LSKYQTPWCKNNLERSTDPNTAIEICCTLKAGDMNIRKVPGTVISNQNTNKIV